MRTYVAGLVLVLVAACSSGSEQVSTTAGPPSTVSTTSTVPEFDADDVPTLALYLAAIEAGMEDTELAGVVFDEAEALIQTGVVFCDLMDEGLRPQDVLRGWIAAISTRGTEPSEDEFVLGGVVLGASVRFICPEYLEMLEL